MGLKVGDKIQICALCKFPLTGRSGAQCLITHGAHVPVVVECTHAPNTVHRETFMAWLENVHPDVHLTPLQGAWVASQERGERPVWVGGISSGKSFLIKLYAEYLEAH